MLRTRLLCAIGVSLWSAMVACQTAAPSGALSGPLRAQLESERLGMVTSMRGLPLGVRDKLTELFGTGTLDIADPGAQFQGTGAAAGSNLPLRRLIAAGCSMDRCLVYYERGGTSHTWIAALFHWTPELTRMEWAGIAPRSLATIEEVRKAALSGAIKGPVDVW
jgi:hypothetical protein